MLTSRMTIPQIGAAMALIIGVVAGFWAFSDHKATDLVPLARIAFVACCVVFVLCLVWHFAVYVRRDKAPDLLAAMVPPRTINEAGAAHVHLSGGQANDVLEVVLLAQNRFAAPTSFQMTLSSYADPHMNPPPLEFTLPAEGVVQASVVLPLQPLNRQELVTFIIGVHCPPPDAPQVLFARRIRLERAVEAWQTALGAAAGVIPIGDGSCLKIPIQPWQPADEAYPPPAWQIEHLAPPAEQTGPTAE